MINQVLNNFYNKLSAAPFCSNNCKEYLARENKDSAIYRKTIQFNNKAFINYIVLDVDRPYDFRDEKNVNEFPVPNIQVTNPINDHVHLFFELENSVFKLDFTNKSMSYCSAIEKELTEKFNSDKKYTSFVSKNPLNFFAHNTDVLREKPYSLKELADYCDLKKEQEKEITQEIEIKKIVLNKDISLSNEVYENRNCHLFEYIKEQSYKTRFQFCEFSKFQQELYKKASFYNNNFPSSLDDKEVKTIIKSVSTWTWMHFTNESRSKLIERTHTSELQKARNLKSQAVRKSKKEERKELIKLDLQKEEKITQKELAKKYKLSLRTIKTYIKEIKEKS